MHPHTVSRQSIWGWKVAAYLFLAGAGAGAYSTGVLANLAGEGWYHTAVIGVVLGPPLVVLGTLFLLWDLGKPQRFWRAAARPGSSWIARGVFILSVFVLLGIVHMVGWLWPFTSSAFRILLGGMGCLAAVLTMVYTGLLLGTMRPIPFWSNPMVPLLFLVSALSTGIMLVAAVLLVYGAITSVPVVVQATRLAQIDLVLLIAEAILILCYVQTTHATTAARASMDMLLRGDLALHFWGGVLGLGIAIPLVAELLHIAFDLESIAWLWYAALVALPGLVGGFCLRYLVIAGGVRAPLYAAGMQLSLPARARF